MPTPEELIPPNDPRFEGAQHIDAAALRHSLLERANEISRGASWTWATWTEREIVEPHPGTRVEQISVRDHDHCFVCYDAAFSQRAPGDLREGWTTAGPLGLPPSERQTRYHWVCSTCFDLYRDELDWEASVS